MRKHEYIEVTETTHIASIVEFLLGCPEIEDQFDKSYEIGKGYVFHVKLNGVQVEEGDYLVKDELGGVYKYERKEFKELYSEEAADIELAELSAEADAELRDLIRRGVIGKPKTEEA